MHSRIYYWLNLTELFLWVICKLLSYFWVLYQLIQWRSWPNVSKRWGFLRSYQIPFKLFARCESICDQIKCHVYRLCERRLRPLCVWHKEKLEIFLSWSTWLLIYVSCVRKFHVAFEFFDVRCFVRSCTLCAQQITGSSSLLGGCARACVHVF